MIEKEISLTAEWRYIMNIFARINELLDYAEKNGLIEKED